MEPALLIWQIGLVGLELCISEAIYYNNYKDQLVLLRTFCSFVLLLLEYCSVVWCSADGSHLKLLDKVVSSDAKQKKHIFLK